MPLFLCRWLNGDCSVVWARTTDDAIVELDQVANAEGCPMTEVQTFQLHFALTDRGDLVLEGFGEGTKEEMVSLAYPVLDQALQEAWAYEDCDGYESLPAEGRSAITRAVKHERSRLTLDDCKKSKDSATSSFRVAVSAMKRQSTCWRIFTLDRRAQRPWSL